MPEGDTLARTAAGLRPYLVGRDVRAARAQGFKPDPANPARPASPVPVIENVISSDRMNGSTIAA